MLHEEVNDCCRCCMKLSLAALGVSMKWSLTHLDVELTGLWLVLTFYKQVISRWLGGYFWC